MKHSCFSLFYLLSYGHLIPKSSLSPKHLPLAQLLILLLTYYSEFVVFLFPTFSYFLLLVNKLRNSSQQHRVKELLLVAVAGSFSLFIFVWIRIIFITIHHSH